jgi:hypothetical protein
VTKASGDAQSTIKKRAKAHPFVGHILTKFEDASSGKIIWCEGSGSIVEYKAKDGKYYAVVITAAHNLFKDEYQPRLGAWYFSGRHGKMSKMDWWGEIIRVEYPEEYKDLASESLVLS